VDGQFRSRPASDFCETLQSIWFLFKFSKGTITTLPAVFISGGQPLVGIFYRNTDSLEDRQPAVIITGSWLTVKEQMPATYAEQLARLGHTAFIFDFADSAKALVRRLRPKSQRAKSLISLTLPILRPRCPSSNRALSGI
jgi:hypothetical protein